MKSRFERMRAELEMRRRDWAPLKARRCFICGSFGACCHREPELLVRKGPEPKGVQLRLL